MQPLVGLALALAVGPRAQPAGSVAYYLTTTNQSRLFESMPNLQLRRAGNATVQISPAVRFQTTVGYGAALTDAAAWVLHSAPDAVFDGLMQLLFGPRVAGPPLHIAGLGLSAIRVPMGVSDFSISYTAGNITYADTPGDWALENFSTAHDDAYILPVLRRARQLNPGLKIIATPWTAPLWLKTEQTLGGGSLKGTAQVYDTYSSYFVRFAEEYRAKGVTVDYITLQNEPGHGGCGSMPCMLLSEPDEARLVALVGRKLVAAGLANVTRILGYDHNWGNGGNPAQPGPEYPTALLNDPASRRYLAGVAWHCYGGDETAQTPVHVLFPAKEVHMTECSGGGWSGPWPQNFVSNMQRLFIGNSNNWGQSALLWNLALDEHAGPRCQGGACCTDCRGVVTVPGTAETLSDVRRNVEFYSLAHFSALVPQGSVRVRSVAPGGAGPVCGKYCSATGCGWTKQWSCPWAPTPGTSGRAGADGSAGFECCCAQRTKEDQPCGGAGTSTPVEFTAFQTPEGLLVLQLLNPSADTLPVSVASSAAAGFDLDLPPGMATLVWTDPLHQQQQQQQ